MRYVLHRRQRSDEADEDLAESIEKLKKELQQSADTIIKRLGSHVTKLEGLLREADDRRVRLETRVADAQRLEWALRQRIEELERRLRDLGQTASVPAAPEAIPAVEPPASPMPQVQEARRTDGDEFAAVLHASILREQARAVAEPPAQPYTTGAAPQVYVPPAPRAALPQERPAPPPPTHGQPMPLQRTPLPDTAVPPPPAPPIEPEAPAKEDEAIIKARALLRAGRTIEQVARETGVEIGALRLMKQMTQRD